jgi:micrococcal nuclease
VSSHRLVLGALAVALALGLAALIRGGVPEDSSVQRALGDGEVPGEASRARVHSHVDGDTIRLVGVGASGVLPRGRETTVRLLEIDTPEHGRDGAPAECYSDEASRALRDLLPIGAEVRVASDRELRDPYGRTLLYLWSADGAFVNLAMVRQGFARAVLFEPNDAYIDEMRRAEALARSEDRGRWGACE